MHELTGMAVPPDGNPAVLIVTVPDRSPGSASFTPASPDDVTFAVHGPCEVPWRVLSRFLEAIYATGEVPR